MKDNFSIDYGVEMAEQIVKLNEENKVLKRAQDAGIEVLSITDHDSAKSYIKLENKLNYLSNLQKYKVSSRLSM